MKKISAIGALVTTVAIAGICGCASKSNDSTAPASQPAVSETTTNAAASQPPKQPKDKRPIEQRLAVGMTMDQVKEACGNPKNIAMNSDGSATWVYNNAQNAWIPNYTLFGGKIHYVTVMFDANGKVKSWSSASTGMY
ncbi:MAG TPA: hypothetical protein VGY98_05515 [Verrucomicrobiae bacterium]|nr:hypothetical protein [Verrucomicrobiae bacterium]